MPTSEIFKNWIFECRQALLDLSFNAAILDLMLIADDYNVKRKAVELRNDSKQKLMANWNKLKFETLFRHLEYAYDISLYRLTAGMA